MGAWLFVLPSPPSRVLCLASPGLGGPSGQVSGLCTPRGAMRWSAAVLFRLYPLGGPHVLAPWSTSVRRAAPRRGIDTPASHGGASFKGLCDGDCAVDRGSPYFLLFLVAVRRTGRSSVHGVVCAVLHSFPGIPGLQVVRKAHWRGALHASWAPRERSAYIMEVRRELASHGYAP